MDDKIRASFGAIATALSKAGLPGIEAEIAALRDQLGAPTAHTDDPAPATPVAGVSQADFDALVARVATLETAAPAADGAAVAYDDGPITARVTALETEVEEINEGLDQLASTLEPAADPAPVAEPAPVATVITDPGTGGTVIVTTDPTSGATLATPVSDTPTAGTVVVDPTTAVPTIDPTLVDGAASVTITGDTAPAHPDIVPPETVVAADPSANVAAQPTS